MRDYSSLKVAICVAVTAMSCDQTALKCTTKKTTKKHCVLRVYLIIWSKEYKDVYMGIKREKSTAKYKIVWYAQKTQQLCEKFK